MILKRFIDIIRQELFSMENSIWPTINQEKAMTGSRTVFGLKRRITIPGSECAEYNKKVPWLNHRGFLFALTFLSFDFHAKNMADFLKDCPGNINTRARKETANRKLSSTMISMNLTSQEPFRSSRTSRLKSLNISESMNLILGFPARRKKREPLKALFSKNSLTKELLTGTL